MLEVQINQSKLLRNSITDYKKCLKPIPEILNTIIFRPIAFPIVKIAQFLRIKPNFCTLISFLFALLSAWQFFLSNYFWASFFLFFKQVFDCVDGSLARLTNQTSKFGESLDFFTDLIGALSIMTGLGLGIFLEEKNGVVFFWIYAIYIGSCIQVLIFNQVKDRYSSFYNGSNRKIAGKSTEISELSLNIVQQLIKQGIQINSNLLAFPDINQQIVINQQILTFPEKQKLFKKYFFWMTQAWSMIGGAAVSSWLIVWALLNNPFGLFLTVFIFNTIFIVVLIILQHILVRIFYMKYI